MLADLLIVLGGALAILLVAEVVIRLTLRLARHYGLSGSFVGLTVLSIGTSLLEIMTHIVGSLRILREPDTMDTLSGLLLGSNIGSDIFQQNFVLPLVGLIGTVTVARRMLATEVGALIAASALLWFACLGGAVTRLEGGLLVVAYLAYLYYLGRVRHDARSRERSPLPRFRAPLLALLVTACFVAMGLLADPVLAAAQHLVAHLPLSASLFGVLVLGICAALPEFMTALVSILKGQRDISAGILIGSNITNPLFGAGLGALISGYTVPAVIMVYDLPVKIATGVLLFIFLWRNENLGRYEALILIALYIGYALLRAVFFPVDF
jgi:cation:H+ antiporter